MCWSEQAIDEKIRELSNCHIVYTGIDFQKVQPIFIDSSFQFAALLSEFILLILLASIIIDHFKCILIASPRKEKDLAVIFYLLVFILCV